MLKRLTFRKLAISCKLCASIILLISIAFGCIASEKTDFSQVLMIEKQILADEQLGVNGLAGARVVELGPNGRQLFVASADDNSLAIFNVDSNFSLTFHQMFINNSNIDGLNGAASLVISPDGRRVYVASFYDSAVAIFEQDKQGGYQFVRSIRDGLPYEDVFSDQDSVKSKDTLGLLGAYDIAITSDNSQLFVASVASNAVSVFDIKKSGAVIFKQAFRDSDNSEYGLGGAVSLIVTPDNSQVITAGFNDNAITIFNRDLDGMLTFSQTLVNGKGGVKNLMSPQGITMSPDGISLYVACSTSNAIVVFTKDNQGRYSFTQSISNLDEGVSGFGGASNVTTSPDGKWIFVASESDNAVVALSKLTDGTLKVISVTRSEGSKKVDEFNGAASVYVPPDGKHLLVTTGKGDSLIVYSLY